MLPKRAMRESLAVGQAAELSHTAFLDIFYISNGK